MGFLTTEDPEAYFHLINIVQSGFNSYASYFLVRMDLSSVSTLILETFGGSRLRLPSNAAMNGF